MSACIADGSFHAGDDALQSVNAVITVSEQTLTDWMTSKGPLRGHGALTSVVMDAVIIVIGNKVEQRSK